MSIRRLGRPTGYNYPVGLSGTGSAQLTAVDYLVVAGGGGGGAECGGGGGAGGFLTSSNLPVSLGNIPVYVGAGGPGAVTTIERGANGSVSIFGSITSFGGGGAGSGRSARLARLLVRPRHGSRTGGKGARRRHSRCRAHRNGQDGRYAMACSAQARGHRSARGGRSSFLAPRQGVAFPVQTTIFRGRP